MAAGSAFSVAPPLNLAEAPAPYVTPQLGTGQQAIAGASQPSMLPPSSSSLTVASNGSMQVIPEPIHFAQPVNLSGGSGIAPSFPPMFDAPSPQKVAAVGKALQNVGAMDVPATRASGALTGTNGWTAPMDAGIYLTFASENWGTLHAQLLGQASNIAGQLSTFTGYTVFDTVELSTVNSNILLPEIEEIKNLLAGGVVI